MAKKKAARKPSGPSNGKASKKKGPVKPKPDEGTFVALPIEREFPPGQGAIFANHFVVQHDGPEVYLMFFQTTPPLIITDSPAERKAQLEKLGTVKSQCVARMVMSVDRMPAVIKAMQETLEKHRKATEAADVKRK